MSAPETTPSPLREQVLERFSISSAKRDEARKIAATGDPLDAEPNPVRRNAYRERLRRATGQVTEVVTDPVALPRGAETVILPSIDFLPINFLAHGTLAARTVGAIYVDDGRTFAGTGFLVGPGLLMTNNHVLASTEVARASEVEFDYEQDDKGRPRATTRFRLAPQAFFVTAGWDKDLDFTIVAVDPVAQGPAALDELGWCVLSDTPDKRARNIPVNIVQHPSGRPKQVVVRQNWIRWDSEKVLHYEADTASGSSGSPVFNDFWEVVALHHFGEPFLESRQVEGETKAITLNEGVRISVIIERLRTIEGGLPAAWREMLAKAVDLSAAGRAERAGVPTPRPPPLAPGRESSTVPKSPEVLMAGNGIPTTGGAMEFVVPLTISVRVGGGAPTVVAQQQAPAAARAAVVPDTAERAFKDPDYSNRRGYSPTFLGLRVDLPKIPSGRHIASLKNPGRNQPPGLLRYEHFSVVVDADRKFAFYTATNIDGDSYVSISRDTGMPADGAEGETWYVDQRMDNEHLVRAEFYGNNSNVFDKGHLTRRNDPTWGSDAQAIRANADTFHWTNCSPQHFLFNESTRFWQGIERHYLEYGVRGEDNPFADAHRQRISVFTGPVFAADDRAWDDDQQQKIKVPKQFWKIVARVEDDKLKATGFLVDQMPLIAQHPQRFFVPRPADDAPPPQVDQFLCSVARIQKLTGLDFGTLKAADTFKRTPGVPEGAEGAGDMKVIRSWDDLT
jgi:endonuclease G